MVRVMIINLWRWNPPRTRGSRPCHFRGRIAGQHLLGDNPISSFLSRNVRKNDRKLGLGENRRDNPAGGMEVEAVCAKISMRFLGIGPDLQTPAENPARRPRFLTFFKMVCAATASLPLPSCPYRSLPLIPHDCKPDSEAATIPPTTGSQGTGVRRTPCLLPNDKSAGAAANHIGHAGD